MLVVWMPLDIIELKETASTTAGWYQSNRGDISNEREPAHR